MFNKLVISTSERRRGRVAKFFCGTSAIYLTVIVGVLALSVLISNPRLADTGEHMLALLTPPPPPGPPPARPRSDNSPPPVQPRNDPDHLTDLDRVVAMPPKSPPRIEALSNDPSAGTVPGSPYASDGPGLVPGSHGHEQTPAPPPPQPIERPHPAAPQADVTRPVRLTSTVLQGKATARRTPDYPPLAKQIHLSGSVSVEVMISPDGRVEVARAVSGHPLLLSAAIEAARGWRFEPTLLNGTPVRVTGVIVFNFTMQ